MGVTEAFIAAGVPAGAVRWMLCLMFSPVMCWAQDQVHVPVLRHALAVLFGVGGCFFCFGNTVANLIVSAGGVYLIMLLARRRCGLISMVFSMTFLIYWWVARQVPSVRISPQYPHT